MRMLALTLCFVGVGSCGLPSTLPWEPVGVATGGIGSSFAAVAAADIIDKLKHPHVYWYWNQHEA